MNIINPWDKTVDVKERSIIYPKKSVDRMSVLKNVISSHYYKPSKIKIKKKKAK